MKYFLSLILLFGFFFSSFAYSFALPAFPGAEGFGSETIGGRGGRVIKVTNLNNSGAGSLREALTASGPRIVVFEVSGTIELSSNIYISNSYLTVAGQTSPGGIQTKGAPVVIVGGTHDVIIRGMRFRPGDEGSTPSLNNRDSFTVGDGSGASNIIFDHCSFEWGTDETVCVYYNSENVTFQNSIIAEALYNTNRPDGDNPHGSGFLIAGSGSPRNITLHHNLIAHNMDRNPRLSGGAFNVEIINNVIYDWQYYSTDIDNAGSVYVVGNKYIKGPTNGVDGIRVRDARVYVENNIGPLRPTNTGDEWNITRNSSESYRTTTIPFSLSGVTENNVDNIEDIVLSDIGANVPTSDSADSRIIQNVRNRTGGMIDSPNEVGGWPVLSSGNSSPTDTDNDGMPDYWENANGLNPNNANDSNGDRDGDDYTNIEEYINSYFSQNSVPPVPPVDTEPPVPPEVSIPSSPTNLRIETVSN